MEIIIALDIGKTRTGIAKSDPMGIVIKPFKTVLTEELLSELAEFSKESSISKLIIGLPVNPNPGNSEMQNFVETQSKLIQELLPESEIIFINESFSSREAESIIKNRGIKVNKDNKELIDMYAAAILLEEYFQGYTQD